MQELTKEETQTVMNVLLNVSVPVKDAPVIQKIVSKLQSQLLPKEEEKE